jgi:uncharacterized RmlC-like cupin family protein
MLGGEEVEVFTGDRLENRGVVRPGDYWLTPAVFIGARKEPTAKESQVMRPELDALIPRETIAPDPPIV